MGGEGACYGDTGLEASGDAEAPPRMIFIAFAEDLGQLCPLEHHAAWPCSTHLPFSSIGQVSNEKRYFFPMLLPPEQIQDPHVQDVALQKCPQ